jgi:hypothetical protein
MFDRYNVVSHEALKAGAARRYNTVPSTTTTQSLEGHPA